MKKGSSGDRTRRPSELAQTSGHYPTRDNVYEFPKNKTNQYNHAERAQQTQQPPRKKRSKMGYIALPMFVFILVAFYLCGQMIMMAARETEIDVETVSYGTIATPQSYTGLIVRDEYLTVSDRSGQVFFEYADGDHVARNSVVCQVKDTNSTDIIEGRLDEIDKDILRNQKKRADLSVFAEDINRIEENMQRVIDNYAGHGMRADMNYVYTLKSQLQSSITQRNEIWLSENVDSLSQLTEERTIYEQQLAQNMSKIRADESGVFALSYDNLEHILTPETIGDITQAQVNAKERMEYISKGKNVASGETLFRIVTSNLWYIVSYVPNTSALGWQKGSSAVLEIQNGDSLVSVSVTIDSIEIGEKESKVVFSSYTFMNTFIDARTVKFQLASEALGGLKIPNSAIIEKSLLSIPRACITESGSETGVLVAGEERARFVSILTITSDQDYYYVNANDYLRLGTVLQMIGEDGLTYTISELKPRQGVYVANSSLARFVSIDIIDQNEEYTIVRAGNNTGLFAYDIIISDAKNIVDGQSVY